jgi:hypothetical protein
MADAADRYTKIVLTVIAIALVTIAVQNLLPMAQAQAPACGSAPQVPCWIANSQKEPLFASAPRNFPAYVSNFPLQPILVEIKR